MNLHRPFILIALLASAAIGRAAVIAVSPTDNLQARINASGPGDIIELVSGTYTLGGKITFPGNRTYESSAGAILQWTGGDDYLGVVAGDGATFSGLTFIGAGLDCGAVGNLTVKANIFQNYVGSKAAVNLNGLHDSSITGNTFKNWTAWTALGGYNPTSCHFDGNTFNGIHGDPAHIFWYLPTPQGNSNCTFDGNIITGCTSWPEFQGNPRGLDIGYNWLDQWVFNGSVGGMSVATGGNPQGPKPDNIPPNAAFGVHVHHNFIGTRNSGTNKGNIGCAMEIMGWDTEVDHNLVLNNGGGPNFGIPILMGWSSNAAKVHDNQWSAWGDINQKPPSTAPTGIELEDHGVMPQLANNVQPPAGTATPDPVAWTQQAAGIGPAIVPQTQPAITPTAIGNGQIRFDLRTPLAVDSQVTAKATNGGGSPQTLGTAKAGSASVTIGGIPYRWQVDVSVGATTLTAQNTVAGGPADPAFALVLPVAPQTQPATVPVSQPAPIDVTVRLHSADGGATWTVQP